MRYISTRGGAPAVSAAGAIVRGIAGDGGLYVPERFPRLEAGDLARFSKLPYTRLAAEILSRFLTDFSADELLGFTRKAYAPEKFGGESPAPLAMLDGRNAVLELWHGPTCAFKDMALQMLPLLLTASAKKLGEDKTTVILVATSGDTGSAALAGFRDVPRTKIIVFYPDGGVSDIQRLQMVTQEGGNVGVCAVRGNFDDAQAGVKRIFSDEAAARRLERADMAFSSANSINWGRLAPQIVYYIAAYCALLENGAAKPGESVNFAVPTGNFGNILAGFYAREMGLPVHKLICASNANNVLTDFIATGTYDRRRPFYTTASPSMDILVSSNLERFLFALSGDGGEVRGYMESLSKTGAYTVGETVKTGVRELLWGDFCDDRQTAAAISRAYQTHGYVCDTHTAVALDVCGRYKAATGDTRPCVTVSTASPYKFPAAVLSAIDPGIQFSDDFEAARRLSARTDTPVPAPLSGLDQKTPRFSQVCEKEGMANAVFGALGIGERAPGPAL